MQEAMLYEKLSEDRVRCHLCAHGCTIADGKRGICAVRENHGGTLYTLVYGPLVAQHVDPIEKKPLYHFYPGSTAYSIAAPGCNFRCQWCQNAGIACAYSASAHSVPNGPGMSAASGQTHSIAGPDVEAREVVETAQRLGCDSVAYTYTEPTIFFEYAYDTARLAHKAGLANVFVTNGYMTGEMLELAGSHMDAANVDLKAFRDEVYRQYVGARLQPVLDAMKKMNALGIWLEVTTLVIPGINDDPAELRDAARFVAQELGVDTPWHLSRFFPTYKLTDVPPTPVATLQKAEEIGREEGLRYVYVGNVPGYPTTPGRSMSAGNSTFCHQCDRLLVRRNGYRILENHVQPGSRCPDCEAYVSGVGMEYQC